MKHTYNSNSGGANFTGIFFGLIVVLMIVLVGVGLYWHRMPSNSFSGFGSAANATSTTPSNSAPANTYIDKLLSFSFTYPSGATVSSSDEGQHTVVMNAPDGQVQIAVLPYSGSVPLTPQIIQQAVPSMPMQNAAVVTVAGQQAVFFDTSDTREAWFAYNGNVYQISELLSAPESLFTGVTSSLVLP